MSWLVALLALGFAVGAVGHVARSQGTVLLGIAMVFAATAVVPVLLFLTE